MLLFLPCSIAGFCLGRMFFQGKDGFVLFPQRQAFPEPILFDAQDPYAQDNRYSSHPVTEGGYKQPPAHHDQAPYSEPRQDRSSRHPRGHHQKPERYSETNIHDYDTHQDPHRFPNTTLAE